MEADPFRHQAGYGLHHVAGVHNTAAYEETTEFFIYQQVTFPNVLQTTAYRRTLLAYWARVLDRPASEIDRAVRPEDDKARFLLPSYGKTWHILLEEAVLRTVIGDREDQVAQLRHLNGCMQLPGVTVGIIPQMVPRPTIANASFWIFDGKLVAGETPSASLDTDDPDEVALHRMIGGELHTQALYDNDARGLIGSVMHDLSLRV